MSIVDDAYASRNQTEMEFLLMMVAYPLVDYLLYGPNFRPETAFASDSMLDQLEARGYLTPGQRQVLNGKWAIGEGGGSVPGGAGKTMPQDFLDDALNQQGLQNAPNGLKQTWTEGEYKYEVRVHAGESQYTNSQSIYRVSRKVVGHGTEYLGTDGDWYHESVLKEFFRNGQPNPNFNLDAVKMTHIPLP